MYQDNHTQLYNFDFQRKNDIFINNGNIIKVSFNVDI